MHPGSAEREDLPPAGPPEGPGDFPSPRPRPRLHRRLLLGLLALPLLLLLAVLLLVANLDSPPVKSALRQAVAEHTGWELDYQRLALSPWRGHLLLEGLSLATPEPHRTHAPHLARLGRLEVRASPLSLLRGAPHLHLLHLSGLELHLVRAADGTTSLDALGPRPSEPAPDEGAEPARPLSHLLAALPLPALRLEGLTVEDVRLSLTETDGARVLRRTQLEGLELRLSLDSTGPHPTALLALTSAPREEALRLSIHEGEAPPRHVDLLLDSQLRLEEGQAVKLRARAELLRQTLEERLHAPGNLLQLEAAATFHPEERLTRVELTRLALLEEAARAELSLALPDAGAPVLRGGSGHVRVEPLLALWPSLLGTLEAEEAWLDFHIQPAAPPERPVAELQATARVGRLAAAFGDERLSLQGLALRWSGPTELTHAVSGQVALQLQRLAVHQPASARALTLQGTDVQVKLSGGPPSAQALPLLVQASGTLGALHLVEAGQELTLPRTGLSARATLHADDALALSLQLPLHEVSFRQADGTRAHLRSLRLTAGLTEGRRDARALLGVAGRLELGVEANELTAHLPGRHLTASRLGFDARGQVGEKLELTGSLPLAHLRLARRKAPLVEAVSSGALRWSLSARPEASHPLGYHATAHLEGTLGELGLEADAVLKGTGARASFALRIDRLGPLARLAPPEARQAGARSLRNLGLRVSASGEYAHLDTPARRTLAHRLEATVTGFSLQLPGELIVLPEVGFTARHQGGDRAHQVELGVRLHRVHINDLWYDGTIGVDAQARVELDGPRTQVDVNMSGVHGPDLAAALRASFDARTSTLSHQATLSLARPGALASLIPVALRDAYPLDWNAFTVSAHSTGELRGALHRLPGADFPAPVDGARTALSGTWQAGLELGGLRWAGEDLAFEAPQVALSLEARAREGGRLDGTLHLRLPSLSLVDGEERLALTALDQKVHFTADGPPEQGRLSLTLEGRLAEASQSYLPLYPVRDVTLGGHLRVDQLAAFQLEDLVLENAGGGTRLELDKTLNRASGPRPPRGGEEDGWVAGSQRFSLEGLFSQRLESLDGAPERFRGRGRLLAPFSVHSGDGTMFNLKAALQLEDVDLVLPESQVELHGLHGSVLLEEALEWVADERPALVPYSDRNVFARVRFHDIQPFLSRGNLLQLRRVVWKDLEAGPIAGNIELHRNVFAINKLKMHMGEGSITGQLVFDYRPGAERVKFRGNVTGVRLGQSRERVDANAAVTFCPSRLELDGRMQVLRLSERQLLEMLHVLDPFGEDASFNRVRRALAFGHPKMVRIALSEGLLAMKVELGGLGALMSLDEVRGVPLGPFMSRHVAPRLPW